MTNGHEANINGRLVTWFVGYGDESTGWTVDEYRPAGMIRILSGMASYEVAVAAGMAHYDQLRKADHCRKCAVEAMGLPYLSDALADVPSRAVGSARLTHWQDGEGKWWHAINQAGRGHPSDPSHRFQVVDMPCDCR